MITLRQKRAARNIVGNSRTLFEALRKAGYSKATAIKPTQVTRSKGFMKVAKPLIARYEKELNAILDAIELKDKNSEEYKTLISALNIIQDKIQLLSGKATERLEVTPILSGLTKQDEILQNNSSIENIQPEEEN
jgi:hypothetical protein